MILIKVTVIIPIYNARRYLRECLDSVIAQSLRDIEIICVDDCSTDDSPALLREFAAIDSRVKILQTEKNTGSGGARNLGIAQAVGQYIIFCDSDDVYPLNALKILYEAAAASSDIDFSAGNIAIMEAGKKCNVDALRRMGMKIAERAVDLPANIPALWIPWFHQRCLIKRDFILENNLKYPLISRGQDPPFMANVFCVAGKAAVLPDIVYLYRKHGLHKLDTERKFDDYLLHINLVTDIFKKYGFAKQALIYLYFTANGLLGISFFINFTRGQRKKIIAGYFNLFESFKPESTAAFFEPLSSDPEQIGKLMLRLRKGKGFCHWVFWRLFWRLFRRLFWKIFRIFQFCRTPGP